MARTVVITKQGIPGSAATGYSPGGTDVAVSDGGTGASSAAAARTNLGLGNVDNTSDVNKPVSTAQAAALQPIDSDLTAIAALTTTAYGRALLTLANQAALQSAIGNLPYASMYGPEPTWLYTGPYVFVPSTLTFSANRGYYYRRTTPSVPISKVAIIVVAQSGNICVAAFSHDAATNGPGTRLATSGSVACPAPGLVEISLGATVSPDWLYVGADNATASARSYNGATGVAAIVASGFNGFAIGAFPAPSNAAGTLSAVTDQRIILVGRP